MFNPSLPFSLLSRVLCIMLPSIAINIVNKLLGVIDETESVVSKRLGVINDEMPIVIDDDDKDTAGVSVGVTGRTIMVAGTCYIPKLNKEKPLGQDASFICAKEHTIGVAYGVGGWAKKGIDSGEYSRELMINAEFAIRNNKSSSIDLMKVLNEAYSKTKAKGSSTACIVTLAYDTLHGVNVGDGRFVVIRYGRIVYKSKIQQSRFNRPFQLGNASKSDNPECGAKNQLSSYSRGFGNSCEFSGGYMEIGCAGDIGMEKKDSAICIGQCKEQRTLHAVYSKMLESWYCSNGGKYDGITVTVAHI
ncbi:hypothetical protein P3S67_004355 [Capsicum chacoense]